MAAPERPGRDGRRHAEIIRPVDQRDVEVGHVPDLQDVHDPDGVGQHEHKDRARIQYPTQEIYGGMPDRGGGRGRVVAHARSRGEGEAAGTRMARVEIAPTRPRPPPPPEVVGRTDLSAARVHFP